MSEPKLPTSEARRTISAMRAADSVKKGDIVGDFEDEGFWILGVKDSKLVPVTRISSELFARVVREFIQDSKLHLFGQRIY